ncbi:MAG: nuclear transport factor 2 family protein [Acidimicrobiales bacterium]
MEATEPIVRAEDLARAYLDALQAKDKGAILSVLADDFVLEVPCNVSGTNDFSDSWRGIETASERYDDTFRQIEVLRYTDIEIFGGSDGTVAFAEGLGVMKMATGLPYENRYVFRFDVEDGKIKRIREYLNPVTSAIAFGIPLPQP